MMMAGRATDGKSEPVVDMAKDLFDYARRTAEEGRPIHEVEEEIWRRVLEIGHEALALFLVRQGKGDLGQTVLLPDGREVQRLEEPHVRCYQSVFGRFQIPRVVYGVREGQRIEYVPLDARLQLPESEFSY